MQQSPYFIKWFPPLLIISTVLILISYTHDSISNLLIEQVLQYVSLSLLAFFILVAYKKERSLIVPRRKFWLLALGSLSLSAIGSILETIHLFSSLGTVSGVYSLVFFSLSHYLFSFAIFYRIASKKGFGQHVLAGMDAFILVIFLALVAFHILNEFVDPTVNTFPYSLIVIINTSLGLFVFFYFSFIQETHWVSRTTLFLLFLSIFIRGLYEISSVYFPGFTATYLIFSPIFIRLAQSAAILWHIDHIVEGTSKSSIVQRTWLPLLSLPLFLHYLIEQEDGKRDVFVILFLLIVRQILITRQHSSIVRQLDTRNEQLTTRVTRRTEQIKASEQQVIPLFLGHPDPIVRFNQAKEPIYANRAAQRIFGLSNMAVDRVTIEFRHFQTALMQNSNHYRNQSNQQFELIPIPIMIADTFVGQFLILHDVTDRMERQQQIEYYAYHDGLTQIGNRRALERTFNQKSSAFNYLALIDLDGFKLINDTYGHEAGDYILTEVARRLSAELDADESVYRLGGDEFALLTSAENELSLRRRCKLFLTLLCHPYVHHGQTLHVSGSIGIAPHVDGTNLEQWLKHADLAMYRVKHQDKNGIAVYHSEE
ncbi:GGDEF domain-containing protein [Exiguobacterium sp. KRL4]|uniref:GGDEF domain-containing protein n=1 Tax=Exiguobacterium sp. KRL4 TaxID=1914536 RepID=UPI0008F91A30|nr:GGDEF domain-containing protein [Exiguobacterium sp. KRL4]OIN66221.1 GGDEF domain-containing protein [Exiguobacterium sp. KRL4]